MLRDGLILAGLFLLVRAVRSGRVRLPLRRADRSPATRLADTIASSPDPGEMVRAHSRRLGGGAFLGLLARQALGHSRPRARRLVLGPPRSGKTSTIVIPSVLAAPGPSSRPRRRPTSSTRPGALARRDRAGLGCSTRPASTDALPGDPRACPGHPSPPPTHGISALLIARAMRRPPPPGSGTTNEQHWRERSTALLAPLLLRREPQPTGRSPTSCAGCCATTSTQPALVLEDHDAEHRERRPRRHRQDRRTASAPRSSPRPPASSPPTTPTRPATPPPTRTSTRTRFVASTRHDLHHRARPQASPLRTARRRPARADPPRHLRTAPAHDAERPPGVLLPRRGRQHRTHPRPPRARLRSRRTASPRDGCLQDLSQARTRWGERAADGFLSLFQTKLILTGIADPQHPRSHLPRPRRIRPPPRLPHPRPHRDPRTTSSNTAHRPPRPRASPTNTGRQRTLPPGDIARLPPAHGLLLRGTHWGLLRLTPWYRTQPWVAVAQAQTDNAPRLAA